MSVLDFHKARADGRKLVLTTCYDYPMARILSASDIDALLVGDSVAMVVHGHPSTLSATMEMMELHTAAVARGAPQKMIVGDMPFLTFRRGVDHALRCVEGLMRAGATAVKLEGVTGHEDVIEHIVQSGIPVMGHLGLIPQSVNALGGHRVQAREGGDIERLVADARRLEDLGCFSMVLECVGTEAARRVTGSIGIPTIGIGAGPHVDGQVLVLHDLLGFQSSVSPKFVRRFGDGAGFVADAIASFSKAVREGSFPTDKESYT